MLAQLRTVQQIVRHLERFPVARARAACVRACFYGSYSYAALKAILAKALDQQPLPGTDAAPAAPLTAPRFARDLRAQLALTHEEARHVTH